MTRLDEIRVRVTEAQGPDEDWATEFTVLGNHIDLMEHARQDIPDLLRVVEAAASWMADETNWHPTCKPEECQAAAIRSALAQLEDPR